MTARCTKCGRAIHFGGRGSKLSEISCCGGYNAERITSPHVEDERGYIYVNKHGDQFFRVDGFFIKKENQS